MATLHSTADQVAAPTLSSRIGMLLVLILVGWVMLVDVQVGSVELEMIRRLCRRRMLVIMTLESCQQVSRYPMFGGSNLQST